MVDSAKLIELAERLEKGDLRFQECTADAGPYSILGEAAATLRQAAQELESAERDAEHFYQLSGKYLKQLEQQGVPPPDGPQGAINTGGSLRPEPAAPFQSTEQALAAARNEALEEAAKVCDAEWQGTSSLCRSKCAGDLAKAIRALRTTEKKQEGA